MEDKALYETCKASQDGRMKKWMEELMKDKGEKMDILKVLVGSRAHGFEEPFNIDCMEDKT